MKNKQTNNTFDYKWVIVVLCFLMVFTCLGFCSSNKSLYLSAITEALGIKRSAFSINDSCRFVSSAIVNLFFGILVHKFGTKKLILAGFVCLMCSCSIYAIGTHIVHFYIGGCFLGVGLSWTTTTMVGTVIDKWCKENKGTIMGAVLAANGLGGALAAQIISPFIYEKGNPFGYRNAYLLVTGILFTVATLILIFFRENAPEQNRDSSASPAKKRGQNWVGIEYRQAIRKPYFYCTLVCIFFTGMILQGITGISAAYMKDLGLDTAYITTVLSIHSLALAGFKFLTGLLYDKCGLRITMTICDVASVIVMILLTFMTNSQTGMILAIGYGILSSLALPLETIMLPIFAGDLFGKKSYHKIMGLFVSVNTAGYAAGTPIANWVFDTLGTYKPLFMVCAIIMTLVTIVFQFIITVSEKEKQKVMAREIA